MKKTILLCSLLLPAMMSIWAQDLRNSISYFDSGYNSVGLNFKNSGNSPYSSPIPFISSAGKLYGSNYDIGRNYVTVCNSMGNEMFTTDGVNVWSNTTLLNGFLFGTTNSYSTGEFTYYQNVIVVPRPLHPYCYYVVTTSIDGIYYTEVDLESMSLKNLNTPLKNADGTIVYYTNSNAITATTHANGSDYWVVANVEIGYDNKLYSYLVTSNGIEQVPKKTIETPYAWHGNNLKISNSGSPNENIVLADDGLFFTGNFDKTNGEITEDFSTDNPFNYNTDTLSVEFAAHSKDDMFVLYNNGDLSRNGTVLDSNPDYKSIQIEQDEKLYISGSMDGVVMINPQSYYQPIPINLSDQLVWSAMAQLVPFNTCFVPTIPTFDITAFDQNGTNYTLPTTSQNGITGTWNPPTVSVGVNNYTFTPAIGQCATATTVSLLSVNANMLVANDDVFSTFTYMNNLVVSPSVLNNDLYNNGGASNSNVNTSFVSLVADANSYLPSDADFYNCTQYHYADFFTSDGRYAVPWSCFPTSGTFLLTYKISSKLCSSDFTIATATLNFNTTNPFAKNATNEDNITDAVVVYPNPSDGLFNIDLTHVKGDYNTIKVYSMMGEQIAESHLMVKELNAIDLSNVPTGYYVAHLSGDSDNATVKLIKK